MDIISDKNEPDSAKPPLPSRNRAAQSNDDRKSYMPAALVRPNLQPYSTKNGFNKGSVLVARGLDPSSRMQGNLMSPQAEPRHGS